MTESKSNQLFIYGEEQSDSDIRHFLSDVQFQQLLAQITQTVTEVATRTAMNTVKELLKKALEKRSNLVVVTQPTETEKNGYDRSIISTICCNVGIDPASNVVTFR